MEIVTLQQSALKSNGANGDHDALSRVKELEESLAAQDRHYNSEVSHCIMNAYNI